MRRSRRSPACWPKDLAHDAHGNVQLSGNGALADLLCEEIKSKLKIKRVRGDTFGYLQPACHDCLNRGLALNRALTQ